MQELQRQGRAKKGSMVKNLLDEHTFFARDLINAGRIIDWAGSVIGDRGLFLCSEVNAEVNAK